MRHWKGRVNEWEHDYGWTSERAKRLADAMRVAGDEASLQQSKRDLIALAEEIEQELWENNAPGTPIISALFQETLNAYFDTCHKLKQTKT